MNRGRAGLVSVDPDGRWLGGRYYLQHLVGAVSGPAGSKVDSLCDVYWGAFPEEDPFEEVRERLARVVVCPPSSLAGRVRRKLHRLVRGWRDARDLFHGEGIDVLYPIAPCEEPGVPLVFWAPDFQQKLHPEWFGEDLRRRFDEYQSKNVAVASRVVVSSEWALPQFEEFFPGHREKGRVLRFCSIPTEAWWRLDPSEAAKARDLPEMYFVLSNQFSHHKNHNVVFEAVKLLRDRGQAVSVVCTGSTWGYRGQDYFESLMAYRAEHRLEDHIRILGALRREEQIAVLRASCGVLQPSLFEGWSTTVEDARTLGKALIASAIPVHEEQLRGSSAKVVSARDAEAWAEALRATWSCAQRGPDLVAEAGGMRETWRRAEDVGRTFLRILREGAAAGRE